MSSGVRARAKPELKHVRALTNPACSGSSEEDEFRGYMPSENTIILITKNGDVYKSQDAGASFKAMNTTEVKEKWTSVSVNKISGRNADETASATRLCPTSLALALLTYAYVSVRRHT